MTLKMVAAPLTIAALAALLIYTQPGVSCVVTFLAKISL
jgi:hypothetical protein